jgi:hypothetical protein
MDRWAYRRRRWRGNLFVVHVERHGFLSGMPRQPGL